jgi:hypothetical protein
LFTIPKQKPTLHPGGTMYRRFPFINTYTRAVPT